VPGHKAGAGADPGLRQAIGRSALALDVSQEIDGIDIGPSPTPYDRAETLAAEAFGATRTFFLTNGATQGNHALALALAPPRAPVVVQRNSHASLIDGLVLSGGAPRFVAPAYDQGLGMAHGVTPAAVGAALDATPGALTVFVVSPTYYGMVADVASCATVAHEAGAALVVDQSWGSHFGFHPDVPGSALDCGADAVLTSTHKTVGSLTQSALLHVAHDGLVDPDALARAVRLVRSTSPSSLLLASLDAARRQLAVHGEALLARTLRAAAQVRDELAGLPGCAVVSREMAGQDGVHDVDPLRIVVDVRETGATGYELAAALRVEHDVHLELATHATLVLVLGVGEPVEELLRFPADLAATVEHLGRAGSTRALSRSPAALENETVMTPRDAFLGSSEVVSVETAAGRVSAETIAGYPPGIPALLPGERITAEVIAYLQELIDVGARLHGASDPAFRTVRVVAAAG